MVKKSKDMANLFLAAKILGGTGGGEQPVLITKNITENGIYSASADNADGYSQVTVDVSPPAPIPPTRSGATIHDFDGSVIATYTPEEFAALTEYPTHPTHEFLTGDGYNWSLANAQAYSAKYGYVEVGAQYRVTDGKTRLFITLSDGRLEPQLGLGINGSVDIDWGDGSAHDTMTGSAVGVTVYQAHKYAQAGDYVITLTVTGSVQFNGGNGYGYILGKQGGNSDTNKTYLNVLTKLYIGSSVTSIGGSAFLGCHSLQSVSIPDSVTSINSNAFYYCHSLQSVSIPDSVTSIGSATFQSCYSLQSVSIPDSVTSINSNAFYYCYSLQSVSIPDSVTRIGSYAFQNCYGLGYIKFLGTTTIPTIANSNAWSNTPSDCYILVSYDYLDEYLNTTNMPNDSTYLYLCYATYTDGDTLPTVDSDGYTLTWYASREDARAQTNPITAGNGKEIYARGVEP